jgi:hypothetical protein
MIALLKQILLCVTAASLFGSVVLALTEQKAQKEIIRIAVGMMLVLALIEPLRSIQFPKLSGIPAFSNDFNVSSNAEDVYKQTVIEEFEMETEAYLEELIQEKEGIVCTYSVTAQLQNEVVSILSAEISFEDEAADKQKQNVLQITAQELGIEESQITFAEGDPDGASEKTMAGLLE